MSDYAIEIKNLNKTYKASGKAGEKIALRDVSLNIPKGSIFGLLGPNGAGKSTLINIMAGLVVKTSGTVKLWDRDIDTDTANAKAAIGIVPQEINYDPFFSPRRLLDIQAGMYGVPWNERKSLELLDLVGLKDKADAYTRSLSGGMKRRLLVAKAMVHKPPILILDEPTAGVDVELRQMLWERVKMLNDRGVTVLLTTHYLEEAEELCDSIAIINHGQIIVNEDKRTLLSRIDNKEISFLLDREIDSVPASLQAFHATLSDSRTLKIRYAPKDVAAGQIIAAVQAAGFGIADLTTDQSDLEDVFLQITRN
ncbi:MAG: multidrug ABC transporter ATP-binding protein [Micavibrio aeruginosavorus]|uniref:Multidrug ABC transporter ATP-binding protein n=1 Tax=Micavibrio aeruginosavorus TaxID=349221 RepID=A0A2W5PHF0_9BACT|nr:MAG: multidrug ABC transporter ATP-binding protein [Micavibrio aeruginosavorus]